MAKLGNAADQRRLDHIGRIKPAAKAHLEDQRIGRCPGESQKGGGGGRLEEAQFHRARRFEDFREQRGEQVVVDQPPGEADALVEADEVGAGIGMDLEPGRLQRGAQEGAGRALAVRAGDMEHRGQGALGMAELREQGGNPLEPQYVAPRRQAGQPVELGLDALVVRAGAVRHDGLRPPSSTARDSRAAGPAVCAGPSGARPCRPCHARADIRRAGSLRAISRGSSIR